MGGQLLGQACCQFVTGGFGEDEVELVENLGEIKIGLEIAPWPNALDPRIRPNLLPSPMHKEPYAQLFLTLAGKYLDFLSTISDS